MREDSLARDPPLIKHQVYLEVNSDLQRLVNRSWSSIVVGLPMKRPLMSITPDNKRFRSDLNNSFPGANQYQGPGDNYGNRPPYNYNQPEPVYNGNGGWPSRHPRDHQRQEVFERSNFALQSIASTGNDYRGERSFQPMHTGNQYNHEQQSPFNGGMQHFNGQPSNYNHAFDRVSKCVNSATLPLIEMTDRCILFSLVILAGICLSSRSEASIVASSTSSNESDADQWPHPECTQQPPSPAHASTADAARGSIPFTQSKSVRGFRWQSANQSHSITFLSIQWNLTSESNEKQWSTYAFLQWLSNTDWSHSFIDASIIRISSELSSSAETYVRWVRPFEFSTQLIELRWTFGCTTDEPSRAVVRSFWTFQFAGTTRTSTLEWSITRCQSFYAWSRWSISADEQECRGHIFVQ